MHSRSTTSESVRKCATAKTSSNVLCSVSAILIHRQAIACCAIDHSVCLILTLTLFLIEILIFMR